MTMKEHARAVCRVYRGALKMSLDWLVDRGKYRAFACALRAQFEQHRAVTDPQRQAALLAAGQHLLYKYRHPEPYVCTLSMFRCF